MSSKARKRRAPKPAWERGYNGHVYWQGRTRLGKVTLHGDTAAKYKYTWEAAGRAGAADDLAKAKRAVEAAIAMADKQLDLFG
jgi:hypothetical protein